MGYVRQKLVRETSAAHEALHVHPLLGRVADVTIDPATYHLALAANRIAFEGIEERRSHLQVWPEFSVAQDIEALSRDLCSHACPSVELDVPDLRRDTHLLGALYVLHGSGFGARVISRNIKTVLPGVSVSYFSRARDPRVWRRLVAELESHANSPGRVDEVTYGAQVTFEFIDQVATSLLVAQRQHSRAPLKTPRRIPPMPTVPC